MKKDKVLNIVYMALSVFVAVLLWLYVETQTDPTARQSFSVMPEFIGEDKLWAERGLKIVAGKEQEVEITLLGRKADLTKVNADNIKLTVNVDGISTPGPHNLSYKETLPVNGLDIVERSPRLLEVEVDHMLEKTLPIELDKTSLSVAANYVLLQEILQPAEVVVTGLSQQVREAAKAVVYLSREDLKETWTGLLSIVLLDEWGNPVDMRELTLDISSTQVTLPIIREKELPLTVEILEGGGAKEINAVITIVPSTIKLSGDPAILEPLNNLVLGKVDLTLTQNNDTFTFDIKIPDATNNLSGQTQASVTVEIRGLSTKKINVGTAQISHPNAHPPAGYEVSLVTQAKTVTLRGPESAVSAVEDHNIRVVADLDDITLAPGQQEVLAQVYIDGYSDVGAVGEYKIVIDVHRPAP